MKHIVLLAVLALCACTSETDAKRALEGEGMSDIQVRGYSFFSCSHDDWYHTKFTATNAAGRPVSGVVCSGLLFKGSTIRY